ncbi:hypothetical protein Hanom_Chr14g01270351 [Helianthus anomalus]
MTSSYEVTRKRPNILWTERCKSQEVLQKRYHDSEDPGNPDIVAAPVALGGTQEKQEKLEVMQAIEDMGLQLASVESASGFVGESSTGGGDVVLRSEDLALQVYHPVTSEELEEGEMISELSSEQILALNEMKIVDDATIDKIPSEPEVVNLEGLEEIVFEGDGKKSTYVRKDGTEFNSLDGVWLRENVDEINEKNEESYSLRGDERENRIQYFNSLLSILTLPFYDVATLAKLNLINISNYEGATLFARKLRIERRKGWKDELYKPQFSMYEQIKYTLDPNTNTTRYKLVYQPVKVMDKIPLIHMKQNVLGNMKLWFYDLDTHEAVIVFNNDEDNFRMLDPMCMVNMLASDIKRLFQHDIFYEDKDAHQVLLFQCVACFCYYRGIHAGSSWSETGH